jgi:hypothetical protein
MLKKSIYNTIIKSISTYGCEVWKIKKKLLALEIDFGAHQQEHLEEKRLEMK